jgi:putative membrane protein
MGQDTQASGAVVTPVSDLRASYEPRGANVAQFLPPESGAQISAAIARVEAMTAGEIVAVVAADSAAYTYIPFLYAAIVALLVPWPFIFFTWWPVQWIYALQLLVFLLVVLALWPRRMRLKLVPRRHQIHRAHQRAVEQFVAQNLYTTRGRTGVLIFVSVAERYAEIIADTAIYAKVPQSTWQAIVDGLTSRIAAGETTQGFLDAIEASGALLAKHFPPGSDEPRGLPNHLIVLT